MPNNLNNNKFITLIGLIDYENNYTIKYLLIYYEDDYRKKHLRSISNQIESFINNNNFKDINPPIVYGNNCEIIGIIIKYENQIINKNEKNYNIINYELNIYQLT